uniref:hypothetical protein n=1 Tax=Flavobacterium sp. TaxID=239 RepID=UPI004047F508
MKPSSSETRQAKSPVVGVDSLMFFGMGILPPIVPVFLKLALSKTSYRRKDIFSCCLLIIFGLLIYLFNASFVAFANWLLLAGFLLYSKKILSIDTVHSIIPLTLWFCISLALGFLFPVIDGLETRIALYGGETNFTGFYLLIFSLVLFSRGKFYAGYSVIFFTALITLSRTAAVTGLIIWLWRQFGVRFDIVRACLLIVVCFILYNLANLYGVFEPTGYVFGPSRIYQLNDSSSGGRLDLMVSWFGFLVSDMTYFFVGYPPILIDNFHQQSEMVVHNSFILKSITCGAIYTFTLVIIAYRILALEVFVVLMAYCFMLHGLISIPLIILLRFLFGSARRIF